MVFREGEKQRERVSVVGTRIKEGVPVPDLQKLPVFPLIGDSFHQLFGAACEFVPDCGFKDLPALLVPEPPVSLFDLCRMAGGIFSAEGLMVLIEKQIRDQQGAALCHMEYVGHHLRIPGAEGHEDYHLPSVLGKTVLEGAHLIAVEGPASHKAGGGEYGPYPYVQALQDREELVSPVPGSVDDHGLPCFR